MARSVATGRTWTLPFVIVPFAEPMQPPWPSYGMVDEEQGLVQADQSHQEIHKRLTFTRLMIR